MKPILITLAALAISYGALTDTKALQSKGENTMSKLQELDRKLIRARSYIDFEALDRILADDWFGILFFDELVGKAAFLEQLKSRSGQLGKEGLPVSVSNDDIKVRLYGDVAVVAGVVEERYESYNPIRLRYSNVYLKRQGEWRAIYTHDGLAWSDPPPASPPNPRPPEVHVPNLPRKP